MRVLLDTHVLLWSLEDSPRLGSDARKVIIDPANEPFVSVASLWEVVIKSRLGKLRADISEVEPALQEQGFFRLGIEASHLIELGRLPDHHRDPFDRMLIAQASAEEMSMLTADAQIGAYSLDLIPAER